MIYSLTVENVSTSAVADTFKTLLGLVAGGTAGDRGKLLALDVMPADDAPADLNVAIKIGVTNQDTAGTPGTSVTAANVPKADPAGLPQLVIEVSEGKRATIVKLFGPLLATTRGAAIQRDVERWADGGTDC